MASGRCLGALTSSNNGKGHTGPVSCLVLTPAGPQNELHIASGSSDQEVKLWKPNGEFVHSVSHSAWVTALCPFQDTHGGKTFISFLLYFLLTLLNRYPSPSRGPSGWINRHSL